MTEEFFNLINLPQTGSLKKEVVNYDTQTLRDVYQRLEDTDQKPTLRRWIREELATKERVRGDTRYSKGFACTSWAIRWCKEWDEIRQVLGRDHEKKEQGTDAAGSKAVQEGREPVERPDE